MSFQAESSWLLLSYHEQNQPAQNRRMGSIQIQEATLMPAMRGFVRPLGLTASPCRAAWRGLLRDVAT
jgi:hypothetical protein